MKLPFVAGLLLGLASATDALMLQSQRMKLSSRLFSQQPTVRSEGISANAVTNSDNERFRTDLSVLNTKQAKGENYPLNPFNRDRLARTALSCLLLGGLGFLTFNQPVHASELAIAAPDAAAADGGFLQSYLLIFISEIGDKTFFIAALLAAKYGRIVSFVGSMGALAVMTLISTALGQAFHAVPSSITQGIPFDDIIAVIAFAYFGVNTLIEASKLDPDDSSGIDEEKAEAEEAVEELMTKQEKRASVVSVLLQTFSLVFAAEVGDRSFLSTIALSAALNPFSVAGGAVAAHASATGIAVIGGSLLSKYLSEKVIGYIGGSLFIVFAITTATGLF